MIGRVHALAACCLLAFAGAVSAAPPERPADCFSAREVREARQSDERTLALRLNDGSRYRVELADACPGALRDGQPRILSRGGRVCGSNDEIVESGALRCAIAGIARIDARTYAEAARDSDRADARALDTVEVHGIRRRGFSGTTAYCLDARYMRGWHEDGGDVVVEVSPKRSGGNRFYRVELQGDCNEASSMSILQLFSPTGGNAICGNPGDRALFMRDEALFRPAMADASPFSRRIGESGLAARYGCSVSAVYPIMPGER